MHALVTMLVLPCSLLAMFYCHKDELDDIFTRDLLTCWISPEDRGNRS